jgi:hypothetical protein
VCVFSSQSRVQPDFISTCKTRKCSARSATSSNGKWVNGTLLGWVLIARSCSCAANPFVCLPCPASKRGCWSTLSLSHKTVSTERAQHTEIPLPRGKEQLRFASAVFVLPRATTWCRLCEVKQRILPRAAAARNRYNIDRLIQKWRRLLQGNGVCYLLLLEFSSVLH